MIKNANYFVPNADDDLHCYQASLRMVWYDLLGYDPGYTQMERLTDFHEGDQTWPFAGWLAAANAGLKVTNVEDFDPQAFVENPEAEVERQAQGDRELVDHMLSVADVHHLIPHVEACLRHPNINFEQRPPSPEEIAEAFARRDARCAVNINYKVLAGLPGYNGHFVMVSSLEGDAVHFQDPGSPPLPDREVPFDLFYRAMTSPRKELANLTIFERG